MSMIAAETTVVTRDSVHLAVRPAEPRDEAALEDFFDNVSDDDRRFRFFSAQAHVGHDQIAPLVEVDHWQTENFLAFDTANGALVATAMLACDTRMEVGEIAVSVRADYKGRGVGWAMLDVLGGAAKERGLKQVIAIEDRDNHAAIELERERGFEPRPFNDDHGLVVLTKTF
ncbi:GNAT family N-acetyltransferase [Croceicoccus bisphenolivorans]|uniref:GNAT family N-acetyltransferase n=1 Tax=Croceicoccus bisphenolivorans TaxID=1783232 RepID=UPI000836EBB1|nr:GNAT family N-acetyltransferase [Croceicoccus bisphenolivorans]